MTLPPYNPKHHRALSSDWSMVKRTLLVLLIFVVLPIVASILVALAVQYFLVAVFGVVLAFFGLLYGIYIMDKAPIEELDDEEDLA